MLRLSAWTYRGILLLYPLDLRQNFGLEMSEIFCDDVADAWRCFGVAGVFRVWLCALSEVLRIAIPSQRTNPVFAVPATSFAFSIFMMTCEFSAVAFREPREQFPIQTLLAVVFWPSLVVALTAIAVVRTGRVSVLSLTGSETCSKSTI